MTSRNFWIPCWIFLTLCQWLGIIPGPMRSTMRSTILIIVDSWISSYFQLLFGVDAMKLSPLNQLTILFLQLLRDVIHPWPEVSGEMGATQWSQRVSIEKGKRQRKVSHVLFLWLHDAACLPSRKFDIDDFPSYKPPWLGHGDVAPGHLWYRRATDWSRRNAPRWPPASQNGAPQMV